MAQKIPETEKMEEKIVEFGGCQIEFLVFRRGGRNDVRCFVDHGDMRETRVEAVSRQELELLLEFVGFPYVIRIQHRDVIPRTAFDTNRRRLRATQIFGVHNQCDRVGIARNFFQAVVLTRIIHNDDFEWRMGLCNYRLDRFTNERLVVIRRNNHRNLGCVK